MKLHMQADMRCSYHKLPYASLASASREPLLVTPARHVPGIRVQAKEAEMGCSNMENLTSSPELTHNGYLACPFSERSSQSYALTAW